MRPICNACNQNSAAINYISNGKTRYRKLCNICIKKGRKIKAVPPWYKAGYRKKLICEHCGFRAKFVEKQMTVFHIDGNLKNTNSHNLKTVCLNCRVEFANSKLSWRESPIIPDF